MKHGSLFSGIGGFDLAAEWMGWENVFHCEWNEYGSGILSDYWPQSKAYGDIAKTDFTIWRGRIDVLTGGFPCQPYSAAGKRLGKDDERHLWPEMLRAIREIQPGWVVGENVRGLTNWNGGLVFDEVQSDLEAEGYEVTPFLLPACGVDAPHERYRIWFVAHRNDRNGAKVGFSTGRKEHVHRAERKEDVANAEYTRLEKPKQSEQQFKLQHVERVCLQQAFTSTDNLGLKNRQLVGLEFSKLSLIRTDSANNCTKIEKRSLQYVANSNGFGFGGEINRTGIAKLTDKNGERPNWRDFPTQSPICDGDDGFSTELLRQRIREDCLGCISEKEIDKIISKATTEWRRETIKAAGNAVVPHLPYMIFSAIEQYEQLQ